MHEEVDMIPASMPFNAGQAGLANPVTLFHQTLEGALPTIQANGHQHYTVILASGVQDGGKRATLAASMACTALSMDLTTHLFMIGDGSHWAYAGHADGIQVPGFPALEELLDSFVLLGGDLCLCSACDQALCHAPDATGSRLRHREGAHVQGMASVLEHMMLGQSVTF